MPTARCANGGIASAKDQVVLHVLIQFFFQRGFHVDLGEYTKALTCEGFAGAGHRIGE